MKHKLISILVFLYITNVFADTGIGAYRNGEYKKAAISFAAKPSLNAIESYYFGRMYLYGYGMLKNTKKAITYFERAANLGFLPAQQFMAKYELLKRKDLTKALHWFKKAADNGDIKAQMYAASAYLYGVGVKKNPDRARRYYIKAAKAGNPIAEYTLAEHFLESRHRSNRKLGVLWMKRAAEQGLPQAQVKLAKIYSDGKLVDRSIFDTKKLLSLAVSRKYVPAYVMEGKIAEGRQDYKQAVAWYKKAAATGNVDAQVLLAKLYLNQENPTNDAKEGFLWALKAAQNNAVAGGAVLAKLYATGVGTEKNEALAEEWLKKAKFKQKEKLSEITLAANWLSNNQASNFEGSGYKLEGVLAEWEYPHAHRDNVYNPAPQLINVTREMIFTPKFVMTSPNSIPIAEYFDTLMRTDSKFAIKNVVFTRALPSKYVTELIDNEKNKSAAKKLLTDIERKAALGNSQAQFDLGQIYQHGIFVPKNIEKSIQLYKSASVQSNVQAMYALGSLYIQEEKQYDLGLRYLESAAFKGCPEAQYSLAMIYENGYQNKHGEIVIAPIPELAKSMYFLSSANGDGLAQFRLANMMAREVPDDMSVAAQQKRYALMNKLYLGALKADVTDASLPVAFFNAMSADPKLQKQAYTVAEKLASDGDLKAAILTGLMHDRGIFVSQDRGDAIYWYQQAENNPVSSFILGSYYANGEGISKDTEKSESMLKGAAIAGLPYAFLNLGIINQQRNADFVPHMQKALSLGNSKAGLLLADYYLYEAKSEKKVKQARDIYRYFANKGDKDAELKLAFMFENGLGGKSNLSDAYTWYKRSAEQGQPVAQYLLGQMYKLGYVDGTPNYKQAKKWFKLAQKNYEPAAVALGHLYETVDDDYVNAHKYYAANKDAKKPIKQYNLGLMHEFGKGRKVDYEKARVQYIQAAEAQHRQAMVQLAGLYFRGLGGPIDAQKAVGFYKKAANKNDGNALYQLGLLSETGVALDLDLGRAFKYYQQAASTGNEKAIMALGRMYQYGLGVGKDNEEAARQYRKLASNSLAQYQLGKIYYDGIEGKRRMQEANKILMHAKNNGSFQADRLLQLMAAKTSGGMSFVEPVQVLLGTKSKPVELLYLDAISEWNRGDEQASSSIFKQIMTQYPGYMPAKKVYENL